MLARSNAPRSGREAAGAAAELGSRTTRVDPKDSPFARLPRDASQSRKTRPRNPVGPGPGEWHRSKQHVGGLIDLARSEIVRGSKRQRLEHEIGVLFKIDADETHRAQTGGRAHRTVAP